MEDNNSKNNEEAFDSKSAKKKLTTRGILLIGIGGLLVVLLIVGAVAWYTRISVVNQMSIDAAQFDFKAQYTSDNFIIRAQDFVNVYGDNKAAPGTAGVIPILIQSGDSQVDVNYLMTIAQDGMDLAFKRRIRFFYIPAEDAEAAMAGGVYHPEYEKEFTTNNSIQGMIKGSAAGQSNEHYEYVYWEWVYDLNPYRIFELNHAKDDGNWRIASSSDGAYTSIYNHYKDDPKWGTEQFDRTDTLIGRGDCDDYFLSTESEAEYHSTTELVYKQNAQTGETEQVEEKIKAYQKAMQCSIDITGALATPTYKQNPKPWPESGVSDTTGSYGSVYIDLAKVINAHNALYPADYWGF